ncbi:hypothetical protein PHJA_000483800 [Phtheirospermum japonicum]|uniref:Uncharacterized protein n=1 Tax=Phtheirospermum japonicum TaxID=374723 RepID=A0A830BF58_9LAMI|nr:hypothetical protein PHJA_000483800 [Phtheirospermum japonicum]
MVVLDSFWPSFHRKTIVCCVCHGVFLDNKILVSHFFSHFTPQGNLKPLSLVRENKIKLFSASISVPVNDSNHIANENLGPSKLASLVWHDSQVPIRSTVQFRGSKSTHRYQPYPSTLISRSPKSRVPAKPIIVGDLARSKRPQTAMENKVEGPLTSVTRPFIMQLEKPVEEMTADVIDVDAEELDLTLKL